jgi:hypothetical protein
MFDGRNVSRRSALRSLGAAGAAAVSLAGVARAESGWTTAETPTAADLHDVVRTAAGVVAVGGGGVVLRRTADGWTTVAEGGPAGNGNDLYGAGVTDDGERVWVVGASGAVGECDVHTGSLVDHSAPNDVTNDFNDVAVAGAAGAANVFVAGDSGKLYRSFENGTTGSWGRVTPGSGAAVHAVDLFGPRAGAAVDGNQTVFRTDDGETWTRAGVADADHSFYGVDAGGPATVRVAAGGGTLLHRADGGWRRANVGDATLRDVAVAGDSGLAAGAGGTVLRYDGRWRREPTPTGANLAAVVRDPAVAVGASGVVVER